MIRQRGGKYHYEFMKSGKRFFGVCEGCTTKREAEAYEKRMRERQAAFAEQKSVDRLMERRRQELTGRDGIPLAKAFDLSLQKPHRRPISDRHLKVKQSAWMDFVAFMAAKHPDITDLAAVTRSHAEEYIALLRSSGRFQKTTTYKRKKNTITRPTTTTAPSSRTTILYQSVCAEVFTLLKRDAGIAENPFAEIVKPPKQEATREAFTPEELQLIFNNLDDFTRPLFIVAITTALREGDICTLRWEEIDLQTVVIRRTMNKTGQMVEIPIAAGLMTYLQQQLITSGDGEYVFPKHSEMYRKNPSGVSYRIKQFLQKLGIKTTRKLKGRTRAVSVKDLHSCRHTFCYQAEIGGVPQTVVQSIVGHMSPEMTRHYMAHTTLEDKRRGIDAMPDYISATVINAAPVALIESDTERAELLRKLEALPTHELRRLVGLASPMCTKALPCASAAEQGDPAESGNNQVRS